MVSKLINRNFQRYFISAIISLIFLYILVQTNNQSLIPLVVGILVIKDLIDLRLIRLFGKEVKRITPEWADHAPLALFIAIGGYLEILNITNMWIWIAFIDFLVDVCDDFKCKFL